MSFKEFPRG